MLGQYATSRDARDTILIRLGYYKSGIMCKSESIKGCEHPERLKGKPEECSLEQIRECHGDAKEHPA